MFKFWVKIRQLPLRLQTSKSSKTKKNEIATLKNRNTSLTLAAINKQNSPFPIRLQSLPYAYQSKSFFFLYFRCFVRNPITNAANKNAICTMGLMILRCLTLAAPPIPRGFATSKKKHPVCGRFGGKKGNAIFEDHSGTVSACPVSHFYLFAVEMGVLCISEGLLIGLSSSALMAQSVC